MASNPSPEPPSAPDSVSAPDPTPGLTDSTRATERTKAHCVPFVVFVLLLIVPDILPAASDTSSWFVAHPRHWLYPLQTIICLGCLVMYRRHYEFRPHHGWMLAAGAGIVGILVWIVPGHLFEAWGLSEGWWKWLGVTSRRDGFDPAAVAPAGSLVYWLTVVARFVRLIVVVPFVEEIFWRGFLMRVLTDPDGDFWKVPFGTHHPRSLFGVTLMFTLAHGSADYFAAVVFGLLMYGVCVRTKSLSACIVMHAVANLLLGIYVMTTGQWGYW